MKILLLTFVIVCTGLQGFCSQQLQLVSPDKKIKIEIEAGNQLHYSVYIDSIQILRPSLIDMELINAGSLSDNLSIKSAKNNAVNNIITAQIPVSRKLIPDVYNELVLTFKNNFTVIFRAYNDGVAYRIATSFKDSITVINETAQFNLGNGTHAWAPIITKREDEDIFHTSFEELYPYKALDSISSNDYLYSPVLVNTANLKVAITESDLDDYPGMFLKGSSKAQLNGAFAGYPLEERAAQGDYPQMVVSKRAGYIARTNGTRNFPWRVLLIAREDKDLPANDLVYRLATASTIENVSWIHPGKCTDEWIVDINLFNVPFKSGINTNTYKYYIDFAKKFGFDRIMMDAGWSKTTDLFSVNPNLNMDTLVAYAKQQGIKISMWTLAMTLDRQLDSALDQFKKWGVDFIMTDFIDRDDQKAVNFYKRITKACAEKNIMIMFHGAYPPKGFNRTYPNNITREGVLGSEYNAWSDKPSATHNLILPFTRMLAGPLDYEPGLLDNATPQQFRPIWGKVMSQTTRCQQLAMFVVYDDPMPIFSGNPSQGLLEPAFMQLLGSLPSTWDTTIVLEATVGEYIITARRHNNNWYIGGMCGTAAKEVTLDFSFLSSGNYSATICRDGVNAGRNAADYIIEQSTITQNSKLTVHLAPGGGFLIKLMKE